MTDQPKVIVVSENENERVEMLVSTGEVFGTKKTENGIVSTYPARWDWEGIPKEVTEHEEKRHAERMAELGRKMRRQMDERLIGELCLAVADALGKHADRHAVE